MLLERKNAVIYGGGGTIGGAVARAFAREGATVHLAGRTVAKLDKVAAEIRAQGGTATTAQVDALEEGAVDAHADELVGENGTLDVSMNLISTGDVQGTPLVEMELADFERPIHNAMRSTYITARAAGRHMIRQSSGVILMFGGEGDPIRDYNIGGFQISLTAVEALRKQLASGRARRSRRLPSRPRAWRRAPRAHRSFWTTRLEPPTRPGPRSWPVPWPRPRPTTTPRGPSWLGSSWTHWSISSRRPRGLAGGPVHSPIPPSGHDRRSARRSSEPSTPSTTSVQRSRARCGPRSVAG
jgi:3-oxoacyl-[acyl-carrier protein] reductase